MKEHDDDLMPTDVNKRDVGEEDMMVDAVGADDDCGGVLVNLDSTARSDALVGEFVTKETETRAPDIVKEEVAGLSSDKYSDVLGEGRVLVSEKVEVMVNEEGVKTSAEVSKDDLREIGVNSDVAVTDSKEVMEGGVNEEVVELCVESVEEVCDGKIPESSFTMVNIGSEKVEMVVVEDSVSKGVVESLGEPKTGGGTDMIEEVETETGLTENEEIIEQPTVSVEVSYGNAVMDDETGKMDEVLDSSRNPESLTTVNLGLEEVNGVTPIVDVVEDSEFSYEEVEMVGGEDAGMDIDEVLGWKDEILEIDVVSGAGRDEQFNVAANAEAEQGLPGSFNLGDSGKDGPVLIRHQEESNKSREPIVYGRRANVEVPLYDALDGSGPVVSEDENLEMETDSEEYDEYMEEEEEKMFGQSTDLLENGSSFSLCQSRYFRPPKKEGEFAVSDLVWGKVRSHPWWPGQIIDPSHASQKAMKYHKKDCYLVAYFGDHSFAWNDSSVLKPFRANFSQIEKLSNLEAFKIAVECSLEEVTRRVELGLACSCVPRDIYKKIEYQVMENGGVRQKSTKRHGSDESASVSSFEPDKLVDYVRLLAQFPGEGNNMDLAMAKAQLSSYGRYMGHRDLPEFQFFEDMLEEDAPIREGVEPVNKNGEKFENNLIETANPNKEISVSDITDDAPESGGVASRSVSSSGLKKRKARNSISSGAVKKQNRQPDKVTTPLVSTPKPSFKIGELIQRAASQLTGPPSVLKSNSDTNVVNGQHADQVVGSSVSLQIPEKPELEASVAEMLSQLHSIAQDPMKDYTFLHTIIPFFYNRRGDVYSKSLKKSSPIEIPANDEKTKESNEIVPEEFDFDFQFDDLNNASYWTDRIIQNPSDAPLLQEHQNGDIEYEAVANEQEKPAKRRRQSNKKQFSRTKHVKVEVKEEEPEIVRRRRENLATEVVLNFAEGSSFSSVVNLNKIFRRFGPLIESETDVDSQVGRARVVFKKCSDAEVAHSSAGKFKIFGSIDVKYELNYTPLVSYKPLPLPLLQDPMDVN